MSQANPQAAGTHDYSGLARQDADYLNTLTWTTGACSWPSSNCSPQVTQTYIEQGTLPGGRVLICRWHAGFKLHLRRLEADGFGEQDYKPTLDG